MPARSFWGWFWLGRLVSAALFALTLGGGFFAAALAAPKAPLVALSVNFVNPPASPIAGSTFFFARVGGQPDDVGQVKFTVRNLTSEWGYLGDYVPDLRLYKFYWNVQDFPNDAYVIAVEAQTTDDRRGTAELFLTLRQPAPEPSAPVSPPPTVVNPAVEVPVAPPPAASVPQTAAPPAQPPAPVSPREPLIVLPEIRIHQPKDGSTSQRNREVQLLAESTRPLESLTFWLDNPATDGNPDFTFIGTALDEGKLRWEYVLGVARLPPATYSVTAAGRHAGAVATSRQGATFTLASENAATLTPIAVSFPNPPSSPVDSPKYLFVSVGAAFDQIREVAFRVKGYGREQVYPGEPLPDLRLHKFYWDTSVLAPGSYAITATAELTDGQRGSAELFLAVAPPPAAVERDRGVPPTVIQPAAPPAVPPTAGQAADSRVTVTWLQPGTGAILRGNAPLAVRVEPTVTAVRFQYAGPASGEVPAESVGNAWIARWRLPDRGGLYQLIAVAEFRGASFASDPLTVTVLGSEERPEAPEVKKEERERPAQVTGGETAGGQSGRPAPPVGVAEPRAGEANRESTPPPALPPARPAAEIAPPPGVIATERSGRETRPVEPESGRSRPSAPAAPEAREGRRPPAPPPPGPRSSATAEAPRLPEIDPRCRERGITDPEACQRELERLARPESRVSAACEAAGIVQPEACRRYRFAQALQPTLPTLPPECQERGLSAEACREFLVSEHLPEACRQQDLTDPRRCLQYVESLALPTPCRVQGITDRAACDAAVLRQSLTPVCQQAGITDPAACAAHVRQLAAATATCIAPAGAVCPAAVVERHAPAVVSEALRARQVESVVQTHRGQPLVLQPEKQTPPAPAAVTAVEQVVPFVITQPIPVQLIPSTAAVVVREDETVAVAAPAVVALDRDGDGLPDDVEERLGSLSTVADSDGDGVSDREEVATGTNPVGGGNLTVAVAPVDQALAARRPLEQPVAVPVATDALAVEAVASVAPPAGAAAPIPPLEFFGRGKPGDVVTLFIYSSLPLVVTTRVNADGTWRYTLRQSLVDGPHEVYVAVNDNTGKIVARSEPRNFLVRAALAVSPADILPASVPPPAAPAFQSARVYLPLAGFVMAAGMLLFVLMFRHRHHPNRSSRPKK